MHKLENKGQKIRVLHIIPQLVSAGAERLVLDLIKYSDSEKYEMAAVSLFSYTGKPLEVEAEESGIKIFYLSKKLGPDISVFFQLMKVFKNFKPHVVNTHLYLLYYVLPVCLFMNVRVRVHTVHNIAKMEAKNRPRRIFQKLAFKFLKVQAVCVSQKVYKTVKSHYGDVNSRVILNGVDIDKLYQSDEKKIEWRQKNKIKNGTNVFVNVAHLSHQKNQSLLIDAFSRVVQDFPDSLLLIVGDGELKDELKKRVSAAKIEDKVRFLGLRSDIPDILNASDIFVLSSNWEGFPICIIEAMAAGKPIVATSVGGVPEQISNRENGLLIPPGEQKQLVDAMSYFVSNPGDAYSMGQVSRQVVKNKFCIREIAKKYEKFYVSLLSDPSIDKKK
jgi:glycosyltransferase involved in cell wall biosynthesis